MKKFYTSEEREIKRLYKKEKSFSLVLKLGLASALLGGFFSITTSMAKELQKDLVADKYNFTAQIEETKLSLMQEVSAGKMTLGEYELEVEQIESDRNYFVNNYCKKEVVEEYKNSTKGLNAGMYTSLGVLVAGATAAAVGGVIKSKVQREAEEMGIFSLKDEVDEIEKG